MILFKTATNTALSDKSALRSRKIVVSKPEILIHGLTEELYQLVSTLLSLGGYQYYRLPSSKKSEANKVGTFTLLITTFNSGTKNLPHHLHKITVSHTRDNSTLSFTNTHFSLPTQNNTFLMAIDNLLYREQGGTIQLSGLQGGAGTTTVSFALANVLEKYLPIKKNSGANLKPRIAVITEDIFSPWLGKLGGMQVKLSSEITTLADRVLARKIDNLVKARSKISHFTYPVVPKGDINGFIEVVKKTHQLTIIDSCKTLKIPPDISIFVGKPERQSYQKLAQLEPKNSLIVWNNPIRSPKHWFAPSSRFYHPTTIQNLLLPYSAKVFYTSQQNLENPLPRRIHRPLEKLAKEILHEFITL